MPELTLTLTIGVGVAGAVANQIEIKTEARGLNPTSVISRGRTGSGSENLDRGQHTLDVVAGSPAIKRYGINLSKSADLISDLHVILRDFTGGSDLNDSGDISAGVPVDATASGVFDYVVNQAVTSGRLYGIRLSWTWTGAVTLYMKLVRFRVE